MGLLDKISEASRVLDDAGGAAQFLSGAEAGLEHAILEYKKATAVLETLGVTVGSFTIGMGLLPEVHTTLTGSIRDIQTDKVQALSAQYSDEALLVALLKALQWARWGWEHMELKVSTVTLHVTLGFPPKVTAEVH